MQILLPTMSLAMGLMPSAAWDGSITCSKEIVKNIL